MPDPVYPQLSQGGNALQNNPMQLVGTMNALAQNQLLQNQNALFQKEFASKQAIGSAYQNALDPSSGLVDPASAGRAIAQDPNAAFGAPDAYGSLAQLRGQQINNDTANFKLLATQNGSLQDAVGAMATNPNLTSENVTNTLVGLARRTNVPSGMLNSVLDSMPQAGSPADLQKWAANLGTVAIGAGSSSDREVGPPNASGAPTSMSRGASLYAGGYPTALPPGQGDTIATNQAAFTADQQKGAATMASLRPLQTALPLLNQLNHFNFGPGSPELAKIKGGLITAGLIDPSTSDATIRQEVGKYLNNYTGQARGAGRSDEGLAQAKASTPNLDLTQPANLALVKNQIAMDRMDAAAPMAFQMQHPGMNARAGYLGYKTNFYQSQDPRAYNFDLMTPQQRTETLSSLGVTFDKQGNPIPPSRPSPAYEKFAQSYATARATMNYTPQSPSGKFRLRLSGLRCCV